MGLVVGNLSKISRFLLMEFMQVLKVPFHQEQKSNMLMQYYICTTMLYRIDEPLYLCSVKPDKSNLNQRVVCISSGSFCCSICQIVFWNLYNEDIQKPQKWLFFKNRQSLYFYCSLKSFMYQVYIQQTFNINCNTIEY